MPRTIIDIPATQLAEIDRLCQRLGISRAEAVRRSIEAYLERPLDASADGFGLWQDAPRPAAAKAKRGTPPRGR